MHLHCPQRKKERQFCCGEAIANVESQWALQEKHVPSPEHVFPGAQVEMVR